MTHADRFMELKALTKRDTVDDSYLAAFYLLSADPYLSKMVSHYISNDGIDFPKMMKKEQFDYDSQKIVADAAHNLFSWMSKCTATPFEISRLPYPFTQLVCNAMYIANGDYAVEVKQNEKGENELILDNAKGRQREAICLQIKQMSAGLER